MEYAEKKQQYILYLTRFSNYVYYLHIVIPPRLDHQVIILTRKIKFN